MTAVFGDSDPFQIRAACCNNRCVLRLRDSRDRFGVVNEIGEFCGNRACVRGDSSGANGGTRVPSQNHFRAVIRMDDDFVALLDSVLLKSSGETLNL